MTIASLIPRFPQLSQPLPCGLFSLEPVEGADSRVERVLTASEFVGSTFGFTLMLIAADVVDDPLLSFALAVRT